MTERVLSLRSASPALSSSDSIQQVSPGDMEAVIAAAAEAEGVGEFTPELLALARRESGFNPTAKNKNKGSSAGGLFQFTDDTARRYGLENKFDPVQNARAAARLLRDNLNAFDGNIDLALAAHHVGPGKARRALTDASVGDVDVSTMQWLADVKRFSNEYRTTPQQQALATDALGLPMPNGVAVPGRSSEALPIPPRGPSNYDPEAFDVATSRGGLREAARGWKSAGLSSDANKLLYEAAQAHAGGDPVTAANLEAQAKEIMQRAGAWAPSVTSPRNIDGVGSGVDWALGNLGNLRSSIPSVVGGAVGAVAGAPFALSGPGAMIGAGLAGQREMRNEQAGSLMREAEAANVGPVQEGNAAVLQPQQYEDIVSASDLSGWLQAPLEAIVPAGVGSALVGVPKRVLQQSFEVAGKQLGRQLTQREMVEVARRTIAKEIADNGALAYVGKETAQGVVQDGATGGAQNLVQQTITNNMAGREGIDREELLDNIIAEAALGGPLSGVGTASEVVQALRQRAADDPRTLSQKAGDAIADAGGVLGRRQGKKDAAPANAALDAIEQEARARGVPPREVIAERIQRLNTPVDLSDAFTEAEATQRVMQDDEAKRATADELVRDILNDPDAPPEWRRIAEEHVAGVQAGATNKYEETGLKLGEAERKRAGVMGIVDTIAKAIEPVAGKPAPAKRGSAMTPNAPRYSDEELYRHAKLYETVPDLRTLSLNELSQLDRTIDRFAKGEFGPEVRKTLDGLFGSPEVTETVLDFYKPGASTVNTQQYDPDGGRTGADRTVMQEDESFSEATERDEENPLPTETKVEWGAGSFKLGENSYFDTKDAAQKERLEKTRGALGRDKPGATPKTAVVGMVDAEIERRGVEDAEAQRAVKLEITNQFFPQMSFMPERPANYDKMDRFARTDYDRRFQAFEKELNKRVRATNLRFQTVKATSETSKGGGLDYNDDDIKSLSLNMGKLGLNNPKTAHTRGVLIFERSDAQTPMITSAPMLLRRAFQIGADREQTGDEVGKMQNLSDLLDMSIASVLDYSARKTAAQQDYAERGIRGEVAVDEMMPEAPKMQFTGRIGYVKYGKPVYVDNLRDLPDDFKIMEQGGRTYTMGDLKAALGRKNADVAREATKTRNKLERMMKSGALNDFPKDVRARIAQAISAHKKNPSNAVAAGALNALYNKHINVDIYNAPSDFERDDIVPSESDTFTDENDQPLERGLLQYGPVGENIPIQRDADGFTSSNPAYNMTGRPDEAGVKQVGELLAKGLPAFRQTWRVASETERSQFGRALRTLAGMKPEQVIREVGSVRIERSKEKDVFVYEKPRAMTQQEGERVVKLANDVLKTYEFPTSVPEGRGRQIKEDKRVVDAGVVTEDVAVPRMRMLRDSKDLHVGMLPVVDDFGNIAMETETRFVGRMTRPARPGEMNRQADTVPSRGEDNMAPASVGRGQAAELEVPMNVEAAKRIPAEFQARPLNTQQLAIVTDALVGMNDLREQLGEFTHIGIGGALGQTRDDWNGARHLGQFIEVPDGARSDKFLLLAPSLFTAKNRHKVGFVIAHEMGHAVEGQIDLDKFAPGSEIDQLARAIPEDSDLGAKLKYPLTIKDKSDEWMAQELHAQLFAAYKHRRAAKEMIRTAPQLYKLIGEYYGEGKSKRGDNGSSGGRLGQSNSERAEARSPRGQVGSVQAGTGGPQVDDGQNARGGEPARAVAADVRADEGVAQGIAAQGNPLEEQLKAYLPLAEAKNKMLAGAIKTALKEIAAGRSLKSHEGALAAAKKQLGELDSGDTGAVAQKAAATDLKQRLAVARKVEFGELDDNASAFLKDYLSTAKWVDDTTDLREEKYALREKKNRTEAEERRLDEVEDMLQLSLVRSSPNENYADVYRDYVEELQDIGNEHPVRSAQIMKILDGLDELARRAVTGNPSSTKQLTKRSEQNAQTPGEATTDAKRTVELKAALDEVKRLLGKDFDAQVSNELFDPVSGVAWSGEFDPQQMRILIAAGATDTMGTGRHEALHALFKMLRDMGHPEAVKVIQNLATNKLVLDKLKILLADHKNALEQLKDPEEAAAYAFQFWMADRLKLGPQAKTFFQKVMNFLNKAQLALRDKVFGSEVAKTERERRRQDELALKLLGAFRDGAMASPEGRVSVQAVLEANKQALAARRLNTRAFGHKFHKFLKQGVHSTASVFEDSANPHVKALGKMFFRMEGDVRGEKQNFLEAAAQANDRYQVKVRNILVKLDKDTAELVSKYMNNRTELKDIHHPEAHEAVKALRDLLKELHLYQRERNTARWDAELMEWVPIGEVKDNYYPRVWSINVLTEKQGEFIEKMTKALEKYRRDFKGFPEIEEFHADTMAKAILNKLINGAGSNDIEEMTSDLGITPWQASVNKRDLNWLDDVAPGEFTEYFSDDVAEVMTSYILQATKRAEYNRAFGRGGEKIREAMFKAMVYEMGGVELAEKAAARLKVMRARIKALSPEAIGAIISEEERKPNLVAAAREVLLEDRLEALNPDMEWTKEMIAQVRLGEYGFLKGSAVKAEDVAKVREGVDKIHSDAVAKLDPVTKAVMAMEGTLGREIDPTLRHVMSGVTTFQNFRLLPLALFASINDVVGMVARGGTMKDSFQAFTRGIKEVGLMWKGEYSQDELAKLAERLGTVGGGNYLDAMGQTYSSQFMYGKLRRWNDALFKWNGLEAWNRAVRIQATGVAIEFIKRHVEKPNEHSKRYLEELFGEGYDTSLIMKDGDLDYSNDRVQEAVLTWVNGAVLRPNASHRPIYASDPHYMLFYHLKQFAYSFHKVILRRAWIEAKAGNYTPAAALFTGYVPVSIAADVVKETLIMGDDDPWWTKGGLTAYLEHGVARANLGGIPQMWLGDIADPVTAFKDPGRYVGSLSNVAGTAPDQLIDLISVPFLEDKTLVKEVAGGVPGGVLIRRYVD